MHPSTAILFVHGILGKPDFFNFLLPEVPAGVHVRFITLKGHCASASEFGRASMREWKTQVAEAVGELRASFSRVLIVAHSMGTLFAIRQAADGNVDGMLLLNPPLALHLSRRLFTNPLKVLFNRVRPDDVWATAARDACGVATDLNPLHYLRWPARYAELFAEIHRTRPQVSRIAVPTVVFYSAHDEMVSARSAALFPAAATSLATLGQSGHYYYSPADKQKICEAFRSLLKKFG